MKLFSKVFLGVGVAGVALGSFLMGTASADITDPVYFVSASDTSFNASTLSDQLRPTCQAGDFATGGGWVNSNSDIASATGITHNQMLLDNNDVPVGWDFRAINNSTLNGVIHAHVVCIDGDLL